MKFKFKIPDKKILQITEYLVEQDNIGQLNSIENISKYGR